MAEGTFDRAAFSRRLLTGRLGRMLFTRAEVESTNDEVWELAQQGADEGACVVADVQSKGRGRHGRTWHTTPGMGLALSVLLHPGCESDPPPTDRVRPPRHGTAPLVAGLALARAFDALGIEVRLKWPNDIVAQGRKLSGVLVEGRRSADDAELIVIGVGVNVAQQPDDFPAELRSLATSLVLEGHHTSREIVAAAFLNALEPLWDEHQEGDAHQVLAGWKERADIWGRRVTVVAPGGRMEGVARDLDEHGGLVIEVADGSRRPVYAGDLEVAWLDGTS